MATSLPPELNVVPNEGPPPLSDQYSGYETTVSFAVSCTSNFCVHLYLPRYYLGSLVSRSQTTRTSRSRFIFLVRSEASSFCQYHQNRRARPTWVVTAPSSLALQEQLDSGSGLILMNDVLRT